MAISALKDLRKLVRGLEGAAAFDDLPRKLRREKSDRATVLLCTCFVDAGLKAGITRQLPNKDLALLLFEDHGPLHSLGNKIKMAEAMDLFGPETKRNLDIIQNVRNAFAHSLLVDSFTTPEVATACNALMLPTEFVTRPRFLGGGAVKFDTLREKFVSISILTVEFVILRGEAFEDENGVRVPLQRLS